MSKIICEVCGTSYPETAAQCPICGSAHKPPVRTAAPARTQKSSSGEYTYVKGGRFSQANVNKRNNASGSAYSAKPASKGKRKKKKSDSYDNRGLIITIIILLLAIVAVIGYIFVKFFMPATSSGKVNNPSAEAPAIQAVQDTGACEEIILNNQNLSFTYAGETVMLNLELVPAGTSDSVFFVTSNDAVATVSNDGEVTAVGAGEAVITVSCGDAKAECSVICAFDGSDDSEPSDAFQLNRERITFQNAGETWVVYNGGVPAEDITWSIEDESIATVNNGKVTAVANGTTTMYAEYEGTKKSCEVICQLDDSAVTADDGNTASDNGPYKLFNIYGNASDVSIKKGESFTLQLVDKDNNEVSGVTWSIKEGSSCTVDNGKITAVSGGKCIVAASYNGKEYTCIVRVS